MNYADLRSKIQEIIFRCHLATPVSDEQIKWHTEGLTPDMFQYAAQILNYFDETAKTQATVDTIIDEVCREYKLDEDTLKKHTRKRAIVEPRQIAMHLLHRHTDYSLADIGWMMGRFDHSTVLHASRTVNNLKESDRHYALRFRNIKNKIGGEL